MDTDACKQGYGGGSARASSATEASEAALGADAYKQDYERERTGRRQEALVEAETVAWCPKHPPPDALKPPKLERSRRTLESEAVALPCRSCAEPVDMRIFF